MARNEKCLRGTPAPLVEQISLHSWQGTFIQKLGAMLWRNTGSGDISAIKRQKHITREIHREICLSVQRTALVKMRVHLQGCQRLGIWTLAGIKRNLLAFPPSCYVVWVLRCQSRGLIRSRRVLFTWRASTKSFCITVRMRISDLAICGNLADGGRRDKHSCGYDVCRPECHWVQSDERCLVPAGPLKWIVFQLHHGAFSCALISFIRWNSPATRVEIVWCLEI